MNIAYQLKSIIGAMSFIVIGMSLKASKISLKVAPTPLGALLILLFSSSVRGISLVVFNVHKIDPIDTTAPIMNAIYVVSGIFPIVEDDEIARRLISRNGVR